MIVVLEEKLEGIKTKRLGNQKLKMLADDVKLFLRETKEIQTTYEVICRFETVSGLEMHRDPKREKCQNNQFWLEWITVKEKIKVVCGVFCNKEKVQKHYW